MPEVGEGTTVAAGVSTTTRTTASAPRGLAKEALNGLGPVMGQAPISATTASLTALGRIIGTPLAAWALGIRGVAALKAPRISGAPTCHEVVVAEAAITSRQKSGHAGRGRLRIRAVVTSRMGPSRLTPIEVLGEAVRAVASACFRFPSGTA